METIIMSVLKMSHILGLCAVLVAFSKSAQSQTGHSTDRIMQIENCLVSIIEDVDVPSRETGVLTDVSVAEGQYVQEEALIAQLDDSKAQLQLLAAQTQLKASRLRASSDIEVKVAQASLELAQKELEKHERLMQKNVVNESDFEQTVLAAKKAQLTLDKSKQSFEVAKMAAEVDSDAVRAAEDSIRRHKVFAPITGNIIEVYHRKGEWVNAGEGVVRLARMDLLRVEGRIDGTRYNPDDVYGRPVTVEISRAHHDEMEVFHGTVASVSLIQKSNKRYLIYAEVVNRPHNGHWMLHPDALVNMKIYLDAEVNEKSTP